MPEGQASVSHYKLACKFSVICYIIYILISRISTYTKLPSPSIDLAGNACRVLWLWLAWIKYLGDKMCWKLKSKKKLKI